ncbi:MAG: zf-HC2 domain-containing protein [Gemmatimonadaceae bacterium]|nr:zf-HC2 domain-containing protein [Gemmatimonadaceae bacterium]
MTECTNGELRDRLPELVNGRLDAEMRATVEAHVAACDECARELALLRALRPALVGVPVVDVSKIAAAVRAHTTGASVRAPARIATRRYATRRKMAIAAVALIAVSAIGYAVRSHVTSGAPDVAVMRSTPEGVKDSGDRAARAPELVHAPNVVAPRTAPAPTPPRQVAVAPPHVAPPVTAPTTMASTGVLDNVSDLSDDDVRTLTASLDTLSSVPDADPSPGIDPLGASLDDLTAGGR